MDVIESVFSQIRGMRWTDYVDIILVAFLIFTLLPILRSTGIGRIVWVACVLVVIAWLTGLLKLHTLSYLFSEVIAVGLLALVVLFQPEPRTVSMPLWLRENLPPALKRSMPSLFFQVWKSMPSFVSFSA